MLLDCIANILYNIDMMNKDNILVRMFERMILESDHDSFRIMSQEYKQLRENADDIFQALVSVRPIRELMNCVEGEIDFREETQ